METYRRKSKQSEFRNSISFILSLSTLINIYIYKFRSIVTSYFNDIFILRLIRFLEVMEKSKCMLYVLKLGNYNKLFERVLPFMKLHKISV